METVPPTFYELLAFEITLTDTRIQGDSYILAGPALFRGLLRAFGKCTNCLAFSKGRPNLASVRLTL